MNLHRNDAYNLILKVQGNWFNFQQCLYATLNLLYTPVFPITQRRYARMYVYVRDWNKPEGFNVYFYA